MARAPRRTVTLGHCPSCRGSWRSLGFVRDAAGYRRRLKCRACGRVCDDAQARLQIVEGAGPGGASPLDDDDSDTVQVIAHLMGSGGLSLREMEVSDAPIADWIDRHGPPASCLRGFAFPAYCWPVEQLGDATVWLVVIDQGRKRIVFRTRRRNAGPR